MFPFFGTCTKSAHNDGKIDIRLSVLQVFTNIGRKINNNKLIHFNPHRECLFYSMGTQISWNELKLSKFKSATMTWMVGIMMNAMKVSARVAPRRLCCCMCPYLHTLVLHAEYNDCSRVLSRLHTWSLKCDTRLRVGHYLNIVYTGTSVKHHFSIVLQYSFTFWSFFLFSCFAISISLTKYQCNYLLMLLNH